MTIASLRIWITRSLWAGAAGLFLLAVAGTLWGALGALGDGGGAAVARGITLGTFIAWGADLVALLVLVALAQLTGGGAATTCSGPPA